jgi:8-oxo-dGTP diphosphatase
VTRIHVAVGVIIDADQRVLVTKRHLHQHQGGLWEFPGGKVEPGETAKAALKRELFEEVGLEIISATPLITVTHDYLDKAVLLETFQINQFKGLATPKENQIMQWIELSALQTLEMPVANLKIREAL